jgi:cobalt/nickel transport system ATP-binding protein
MPAGVHIKNLDFSYTPDTPVLRNISVDIHPGEKFGIIGPSGSGKSTLLLHLNGILTADSGLVEIGGIKIEKKTLAGIRKLVGLVFQNPDDQLFNPTVEEDIAFGPLNFGFSREEVDRRVQEALSAMHLTGFEKLTSHHLSLGERKRVALATVLSISPEVIAFDEPFSSLDPEMVMNLIQLINGLDATLIIVSQSFLPLIACCDRIAILKNGEIIAVGPKDEIIRDKELMRSSGMDLSLYRTVYREYFMN